MQAFTTRYRPGPNWGAGWKYDEKPGFPEQLRWWKDHAREGRFRMLGLLLEQPEVLVAVWTCDSLETAQALAASSPMVRSGQLVAVTEPGEPKRCGEAPPDP